VRKFIVMFMFVLRRSVRANSIACLVKHICTTVCTLQRVDQSRGVRYLVSIVLSAFCSSSGCRLSVSHFF